MVTTRDGGLSLTELCTLQRVDPVGFEPTIFSLQRRRLPARPRAPAWPLAVPTRGLEPPHLAVIDPKSIASAIPPRRHSCQRTRKFITCCASVQIWGDVYSRFCPAPGADPSSISAQGCPVGWRSMASRVLPDAPAALRRDSTAIQPNPLTLLPVARSPSHVHFCTCW